jgi:hypothetical protein
MLVFALEYFYILILRIYTEFELFKYSGTGKIVMKSLVLRKICTFFRSCLSLIWGCPRVHKFCNKNFSENKFGGTTAPPPSLPQIVFFKELFKTEKCLEVPEMARKLTRKFVNQICPPPKKDKKNPLFSMGGQSEGQHV